MVSPTVILVICQLTCCAESCQLLSRTALLVDALTAFGSSKLNALRGVKVINSALSFTQLSINK